MSDTNKDFSVLYDQMLMRLSGEDRLNMCSSMFDTARNIIISSLPENISASELKKQLFLRLYADDFGQEEKELIINSYRS